MFDTIDYRNVYGAEETNGLYPGQQQELLDALDGQVYWNDPTLAKITRLRLLSDRGFPFWDVSYCYGVLKDGTYVRVDLPFHQLSKYKMKADIIKWAKEDGVYAKGLGILDDSIISKLQ
jgi:hypothetical protein